MKTYFITGVMGFIGQHWAKKILSNGDKVIGIDLINDSEDLFKYNNFIFYKESILNNKNLLDELIKNSDIVLHLASIAEPERYLSDPKTVLEISALASFDIINICVERKKKLFFTSTSEIYGKSNKIPFDENDDRILGSTTIKRWCYSTSKAMVEHYLEACSFKNNLEFRVVRLFNIYGPNLKNRVVTRFIEKAIKNEDLEINNGGIQTRCFTYISDSINAFEKILKNDNCKNQIFNVGSTIETSILELAKIIIKLSASKSKIVSKTYQEQFGESYEDIRRRVPTTKKIQDFTGWKPEIDLHSGLKMTIDYYKNKKL